MHGRSDHQLWELAIRHQLLHRSKAISLRVEDHTVVSASWPFNLEDVAGEASEASPGMSRPRGLQGEVAEHVDLVQDRRRAGLVISNAYLQACVLLGAGAGSAVVTPAAAVGGGKTSDLEQARQSSMRHSQAWPGLGIGFERRRQSGPDSRVFGGAGRGLAPQ